MIFRFSLYGFLKNQRYFEPFLVLAFVDKGLSYFAIGALIAFREVATNLLEIPSGAAADLLGRRRAMITAFVAYVASFVGFGLARSPWLLFAAMALFAVGEAFRSGTHKAMIFAWLRGQGREGERTRVYGYTRSWSKIGSAVAVVVGAVFVFAFDDYSVAFLLAAAPALANVVNFLGYPRDLDGGGAGRLDLGAVWRHTRAAVVAALRRGPLRRLVVEAMAFGGVFHAAKDYLQPLLAAAATGLIAQRWASTGWSDVQQSTVLVGPVYLALYLLSGVASRQAHRVVAAAGGDEERAATWLWVATAGAFAALLGGELAGAAAVSIAAFVALHVVQNVWRPVLIGRIDTVGDPSSGAVTMSVESQFRRLATMLLAPLFGWAVDVADRGGGPGAPGGAGAAAGAFWSIGAVGLGVALAILVARRRRR